MQAKWKFPRRDYQRLHCFNCQVERTHHKGVCCVCGESKKEEPPQLEVGAEVSHDD